MKFSSIVTVLAATTVVSAAPRRGHKGTKGPVVVIPVNTPSHAVEKDSSGHEKRHDAAVNSANRHGPEEIHHLRRAFVETYSSDRPTVSDIKGTPPHKPAARDADKPQNIRADVFHFPAIDDANDVVPAIDSKYFDHEKRHAPTKPLPHDPTSTNEFRTSEEWEPFGVDKPQHMSTRGVFDRFQGLSLKDVRNIVANGISEAGQRISDTVSTKLSPKMKEWTSFLASKVGVPTSSKSSDTKDLPTSSKSWDTESSMNEIPTAMNGGSPGRYKRGVEATSGTAPHIINVPIKGYFGPSKRGAKETSDNTLGAAIVDVTAGTVKVDAAARLAGHPAGRPWASKRQIDSDVGILNYALTLEHLEDKFYREGLANYTQAEFIAAGFADPFYDNLMEVSKDETTHVSFLTTALGSDAVAECTYSFPSTDPASFVALASVLEGVGVSAYLGAAADITSPAYLTAAGSILTVEARHSAYLRSALKESPFPQPFDNPLDFEEVYTLAAGFIVSCPSTNADLGLTAFPALSVTSATSPIKSGDTITLLTTGYVLTPATAGTQLYAAFITATGPIFNVATPVDGGFTVEVPQGINGQSYAVLTACKDLPVSDDTVVAGPAIIEIEN